MWVLAAMPIISTSGGATNISTSKENSVNRQDSNDNAAATTTSNMVLGVTNDVTEDLITYESIGGSIVEATCMSLVTIMSAIVAGEGVNKDDSQSLLESIYRTQLIRRLIEVCRNYGGSSSLSATCISAIINILSELVLSSSKFLAQVSYKSLVAISIVVIITIVIIVCRKRWSSSYR